MQMFALYEYLNILRYDWEGLHKYEYSNIRIIQMTSSTWLYERNNRLCKPGHWILC